MIKSVSSKEIPSISRSISIGKQRKTISNILKLTAILGENVTAIGNAIKNNAYTFAKVQGARK